MLNLNVRRNRPESFPLISSLLLVLSVIVSHLAVNCHNATCAVCPRGSFADQSNATNFSHFSCSTENSSSYFPKRNGLIVTGWIQQGVCTISISDKTSCQNCTVSNQTGSCLLPIECTKCEPGYYQNETGAVDCLKCSTGAVCPNGGCMTCFDCSPGYYSNENGTACSPCPAGFYSNKTGSIGCTPCSPGSSTSNHAASRSCPPCPISTYCNATACGSCTSCPPGTQTADVGQTDCVGCGPGTYRDSGEQECKSCKLGYYTDSYKAARCRICPLNFYCPCSSCKYPCSSNSLCPPGSSSPGSCLEMYVISTDSDEKRCVWSVQLYLTVFGVIAATLAVLGIIVVTIIRRRRRLRSDSTRSLVTSSVHNNSPTKSYSSVPSTPTTNHSRTDSIVYQGL